MFASSLMKYQMNSSHLVVKLPVLLTGSFKSYWLKSYWTVYYCPITFEPLKIRDFV